MSEFDKLLELTRFWTSTSPKLGDKLLRYNLSRFTDTTTVDRLIEKVRKESDGS